MQHDLFAEPDTCSGKTSPEHSAATTDETLLSWLAQWLGPSSVFRETDGKTPELLPAKTGASSGALWTRNSSEWNHIPAQSRSGGAVCSLSSILETGNVERRYFLSAKACQGILRRAERRGKELPVALERALLAVADKEPTTTVASTVMARRRR
jgi:hypothetical protein